MLQIMINNKPHQIGQPLPTEILAVDMQILAPLQLIRIPKQQLPSIKQWFNALIFTASCEYFVLNSTFYRVDELSTFPEEELK